MLTYLVESYEPHVTVGDASARAADVAEVARSLGRVGTIVQPLEATLVPGDETGLYVFKGPSVEVVRAAAEAAGIRVRRVSEVVHLCTSDEPKARSGR